MVHYGEVILEWSNSLMKLINSDTDTSIISFNSIPLVH